MISAAIYLIATLAVMAVVYWVVTKLPLPDIVRTVIIAVLAIIFIVVVLKLLLPIANLG